MTMSELVELLRRKGLADYFDGQDDLVVEAMIEANTDMGTITRAMNILRSQAGGYIETPPTAEEMAAPIPTR